MSENYQSLVEAIEKVGEDRTIGIELHYQPDPDAIGAGFAMQMLVEKLGRKSELIHGGGLSNPGQRIMANRLSISLINHDNGDPEPDQYDYFIFVDHHGSTSSWYKNEKIPDEKVIAVVDHHNVSSPLPDAWKYTDIRDVGSASTIVAEYVRDAGEDFFEPEELERVATALFAGIVTDTGDLRHRTTSLDREMHAYLSTHTNQDTVDRIQYPPVPIEWFAYLKKAMDNLEIQSGVAVANVGYLKNEKEDRDVIPWTADFLLRAQGVETVYVVGIKPNELDISVRTNDEALDFNTVLEKFPQRSGGGGKKGAASFKIPNQFADGAYVTVATDPSLIEQLIWKETKHRIFS